MILLMKRILADIAFSYSWVCYRLFQGLSFIFYHLRACDSQNVFPRGSFEILKWRWAVGRVKQPQYLLQQGSSTLSFHIGGCIWNTLSVLWLQVECHWTKSFQIYLLFYLECSSGTLVRKPKTFWWPNVFVQRHHGNPCTMSLQDGVPELHGRALSMLGPHPWQKCLPR